MALQPHIIACGTKMATIGMVIRFVSGPILMSASSVAVGLRGARLHTAIVQVRHTQTHISILLKIKFHANDLYISIDQLA